MNLILLLHIAAIFDSIRDLITLKFDQSMFFHLKNNWIGSPFETWMNKYDREDPTSLVFKIDKLKLPVLSKVKFKERFPGASTVFVAITDLFHFTKLGNQLALFAAIFYPADLMIFPEVWQNFLAFYTFENLIFTLYYNLMFKRFKTGLANNISLIFGLGLIFIGIGEVAFVLDPSFTIHADINTSFLGFWIMLSGFASVIISAIIWLVKSFSKNSE